MSDVASASGPAATGLAEPAIVARSLTRKFRELVAVDRIDLSVPAGSPPAPIRSATSSTRSVPR